MTERGSENELALPPHRPLPPYVRDRMLTEVRAGLHSGPRRPVRAPLVAAAVAVLAGGAFVVTGTTGGDSTVSPASGGSAELDRCAAAVERAGRTADYPGRASWEVSFSESLHLTTLTAIRAGDETVFCETSETSVSLSVPVAADDRPDESGVRAAMTTPNGTVVGFVRGGVDGVNLALPADEKTRDTVGRRSTSLPGHGRHGSITPARDDVFYTAFAHHDISELTLTATTQEQRGENFIVADPGISLPPAPPEVFVTDRAVEEPDRSSEEGRSLAECLEGPGAGLGGAVVDAGTWRAGARVQRDVEAVTEGDKTSPGYELSFVVAVNDRAVGICGTSPGWRFSAHPLPDDAVSPGQPVAPVKGGYEGAGFWVAGVLDEDVARVELVHDGDEISAEVRERTFAAFVPDLRPADETGTAAGGLTVRAYDDDGALVHEGPLPRIPKK